jgi:nucleotide-binding universal stress UspA family protein
MALAERVRKNSRVLKTILLALDCLDGSPSVIQSLNTLRIQSQTKIILAHVLPPPVVEGDLAADRPHQSAESLYQNAEQQLQSYQTQIPNSAIEIVSGDVSEEIIRLANIYQVDLIIVGTRGLKGIERAIGGSVSSQVVADAPCAVLVVKS